jgi:serine/threonine-protein kinase RsbW
MVAGLRAAPAPAAAAVQQWYVADVKHLRQLRSSLQQAIEAQLPTPGRERDDVAERMTIVATELTTNALQHGRSEAIVRLNRSPKSLVLDVADDSPDAAPQVGPRGPLETGGRGLQITQELALETGWYVKGGRKHVWAAFSIPRRTRRLQAPRISIFELKTLIRLLRRLST